MALLRFVVGSEACSVYTVIPLDYRCFGGDKLFRFSAGSVTPELMFGRFILMGSGGMLILSIE
jgi:hypothetical protein